MSAGPGGGEQKPPPSTSVLMANSTLPTVSMAPLGGPVVPEVYTSVARSSGRAWAMSRSRASGCSSRWRRPRATKSVHDRRRSSW
jgi:hypothetical protein